MAGSLRYHLATIRFGSMATQNEFELTPMPKIRAFFNGFYNLCIVSQMPVFISFDLASGAQQRMIIRRSRRGSAERPGLHAEMQRL